MRVFVLKSPERGYGFSIGTVLFLFFCFNIIFQTKLPAQCNCEEYIYLNEPEAGGKVHKFRVNPDGSVFEIFNTGGTTWYPGANGSEMSSPHGLGVDINGFFYISETVTGNIRKLNCEGGIELASDFEIVVPNYVYNITSIGNIIYTSYGESYDICDAQSQGSVCFNGPGSVQQWHNWGLWYDENTGYFYQTAHSEPTVYRFTQYDYGSGICIDPFINEGTTAVPVVGTNTLPQDVGGFGITTDRDGNIYVDYGGYNQPGGLLKYDANGNFIKMSIIDTAEDGAGYWGNYGVVYSETCNCLYVSNLTNFEDCLSRFDTELNYTGVAVGPTGDTGQGQTSFSSSKALAINTECCPNITNQTINQEYCSTQVGDQVFLIDFLPCENICSGTWSIGTPNEAGTFNPCNSSLTYQQPGTSCFSYDYVPDLSNPSNLCNEFHFDICITFDSPPTVVLDDAETCPETSTSFSVDATGGQTPYTYSWTVPGGASNPGNSPDVNSTITGGIYVVTVTDGNDCSASDFGRLTILPCDFPHTDNRYCSGELPCHEIDNNLYLGSSISNDPDPSVPTDDNDGFLYPNNIHPGNVIHVRAVIVNNTGNTAHLKGWIDWNNDGDFNDANEEIEDNAYPSGTYNGSYTVSVPVTVPDNVVQDEDLGVFWRLSTDAASIASPCLVGGVCSADGEVEYHNLRVSCKTDQCLPAATQVSN